MIGLKLRGIALAAAVAASLACRPAMADDAPTGLLENVTFRDYPDLARSSEVLARVFSPLTVADIRRDLARSGKALGEVPLDVAAEKFLLYVPQQKPPGGYGLLVFVPPWENAQLPAGWGPVLDKTGLIFVSAARSGNVEDVVSRREPLALVAAKNVMTRYPVDPSRVFVGGMSGGARMALRLALGWPDLFQGALLNSGSDVIGTLFEPLPPAALFHRFQTTSRLIYVTGEHDAANLEQEARSRSSMRQWCVADTRSIPMPYAGHEVMPSLVLARALDQLLDPARPDPARLQSCRSGIEADMADRLAKADQLIAGGRRDEAGGLLRDIDAKFGGLAAPKSLELERKLNGTPP